MSSSCQSTLALLHAKNFVTLKQVMGTFHATRGIWLSFVTLPCRHYSTPNELAYATPSQAAQAPRYPSPFTQIYITATFVQPE